MKQYVLALIILCGNVVAQERIETPLFWEQEEHPPIQHPEIPEEFWERVSTISVEKMTLRLRDGLSPGRVWMHELTRTDPDHFPVSFGYVTSSTLRAFRDLAVESPEVDVALERLINVKDKTLGKILVFVKNLFVDSIGNTAEEDLSAQNANTKHSEEELKEQLKERRVKAGIRPGWPNSYVYVSSRVGRYQRQHFYWHTRYYFKKFEEHQVEALFLAPLAQNWSISTGGIYSSDHERKKYGQTFAGSVRLEKLLNQYLDSFTVQLNFYKGADIFVSFNRSF